jgi:hypothetical protein
MKRVFSWITGTLRITIGFSPESIRKRRRECERKLREMIMLACDD